VQGPARMPSPTLTSNCLFETGLSGRRCSHTNHLLSRISRPRLQYKRKLGKAWQRVHGGDCRTLQATRHL